MQIIHESMKLKSNNLKISYFQLSKLTKQQKATTTRVVIKVLCIDLVCVALSICWQLRQMMSYLARFVPSRQKLLNFGPHIQGHFVHRCLHCFVTLVILCTEMLTLTGNRKSSRSRAHNSSNFVNRDSIAS